MITFPKYFLTYITFLKKLAQIMWYLAISHLINYNYYLLIVSLEIFACQEGGRLVTLERTKVHLKMVLNDKVVNSPQNNVCFKNNFIAETDFWSASDNHCSSSCKFWSCSFTFLLTTINESEGFKFKQNIRQLENKT